MGWSPNKNCPATDNLRVLSFGETVLLPGASSTLAVTRCPQIHSFYVSMQQATLNKSNVTGLGARSSFEVQGEAGDCQGETLTIR